MVLVPLKPNSIHTPLSLVRVRVAQQGQLADTALLMCCMLLLVLGLQSIDCSLKTPTQRGGWDRVCLGPGAVGRSCLGASSCLHVPVDLWSLCSWRLGLPESEGHFHAAWASPSAPLALDTFGDLWL